MQNSDALRGSEADRYRWAQNAADECFKEIAESGSRSSGKSSDSGGLGWLWLLGGLGLLYWMWYRPDVNGFAIPFVDSPEARAAKLAEANKSDAARSYDRTLALRSQLGLLILMMTIEEIAAKTESDNLSTVIWLAENNKTCENFNGLDSVTIEDLEKLTGTYAVYISEKLSRRGMKCMESKKPRKK